MKEKLTLLLLLLALTATAQTEHVRFLGVPLDGSIQQFQEELIARECSHDPETSATLPDGVRAFKGTTCKSDTAVGAPLSTKTSNDHPWRVRKKWFFSEMAWKPMR